jgi:hypothetical protein
MKIDSFENLMQMVNNVNQQIELLDEQDMKECPDMEDYQFVIGELHKLIKLEATIEYPYWIRLHTTAEDLISQITPVKIEGLPQSKELPTGFVVDMDLLPVDPKRNIQEFMSAMNNTPTMKFWNIMNKPKPNFIVRCVKKIYTKVSSFLGK